MDQEGTSKGDAFSKVLRDEVTMLRPQTADPALSAETCADRAQLVGLAFSGGGIRSATFCLGIIQALARLDLLRTFDYLSTVSGGGYIGGWLSALIHRTRKPGQSNEQVLAELEHELSGEARPWCAEGTPASNCPPEHPSLRFLRRFSNYLTPRLGLLSGDSLAAISTYLRNLLLNQLILVAFFGALLTLPYLVLGLGRDLVELTLRAQMGDTGLPWLYGLVIGPMLLAVGACALSLMRFHKGDKFNLNGPRPIIAWIVVPSLVSAWGLAAAMQSHPEASDFSKWQWVWVTMLVYLVPWFIAFWFKLDGNNLAMTAMQKMLPVIEHRNDPARYPEALQAFRTWAESVLVFCVRFAWQIPWTLLAGALGGLLFYALREGAEKLPRVGGFEYATAFGTPLVLLGFSAVVTLHIGLMKRLYYDNDREWWARLGGFILLAAAIWTLVFAVTLFASPLVKWLAGLAMAGGLAWAITSVGGVLLGKSTATGQNSRSWTSRLALVAPYVFILGLAIGLASVLHALLASQRFLCEGCMTVFAGPDFLPIVNASLLNLQQVALSDVAWVGAVCALAFGLLGWRVDINLFSLHGFYRNRLTRCFLGATRVSDTVPVQIERNPHPFTGFDHADDLPLSSLSRQRPYHIVNAAMNLNGGENLAWQTRRAAAFAYTPCHTGFEFWNSAGQRVGAYRCTEEYSARQFARYNVPGGVLLGNVMATSGAAANPNMGYHTSAALSALMSVFNVRLGRWCGNPLHPTAWRKGSPLFGGLSLIQEVFGMLDSRSRFLNVSDGGHFENLGIYELVRRRCHVVVAVDAGCDPNYQYEDLANAIRKCWTDFGTRIRIDLAAMRPRKGSRHLKSHFAVGCIHYPDGGEPGILIYIKASLSGDETSDVREYADRHDSFPHQSTGDQFFDENQFESYRELGRHVGLKVFAPLFPPREYEPSNVPPESLKPTARDMTPQQLRDELPGRLLDHPLVIAPHNAGRARNARPAQEDAQDRKNWFNAVVATVSSRLGKGADKPAEPEKDRPD